MTRYQRIEPYDVSEGQKVRVTLRHERTHGTLTLEDKITAVHTAYQDKPQLAITVDQPTYKRVPVVERFEFADGFLIYVDRPSHGWRFQTIERALPPLPTRIGSAVLSRGRLAILSGVVDEPDGVWFWADGTGQVPVAELQDADIVHEAR